MADYRVIKKGEDKYRPEVRKKLFWHSIKDSDGEKKDSKISFGSFDEARNFVFNKIKNDND